MLGPPLGRAVLVCPGVPRPAYVGPQKALRGCSEEERTATNDRLQRLTREGLNQLLDLSDLPKGGTKVRLATAAHFLEAFEKES
jgi:hypothetical protein